MTEHAGADASLGAGDLACSAASGLLLMSDQ